MIRTRQIYAKKGLYTRRLSPSPVYTPACGGLGRGKKTLLIMKLTGILFIIGCLQLHATSNAQGITMKLKNAPLETAFKEIKRQTGYTFLYADDLLLKAKKVTITVRNGQIEEVLTLCFKNQPLSYEIINNSIVVKEKEKEKSPNREATHEEIPLIDISGKVTDEESNPLAGANVKVKGTDKGTATNNEGVFLLKGVEATATLEISYVGYQTITLSVSNRTSLVVSLKLNITTSPEVIVRKGYYDERRATTTGNVSTVTAKDIEKQPINNPLLALEGRVPGVQIGQSNGLPGSSVSIKIRGTNNLTGGNNPLFIIDGVPYQGENLFLISGGGVLGSNSGSPFSYINPSDIESIDVLKDADATAIYGTRGANGVVLITTKKGKPGKTNVDFNIQSGIGKVPNEMKVLNSRQYLDLRYEAFKNDGAFPDKNVDYDLTLWDTTRYTDWQKILIGGTSHYNHFQSTISGGNSSTQFLISATYHKETTVIPGDFSDVKGSVHFNLNNTSLNQKFKTLLSAIYVNDNNTVCPVNMAQVATQLMPNAPPLYDSNGDLNWAPSSSGVSTWPNRSNPLALLLTSYNSKTNNLISNANIGYSITKDLEIKTEFGYSNTQSLGLYMLPLKFMDPALWPISQRSSIFSNGNIQSWIIEPQVNFSKKLNKDAIAALLGVTIQQSQSHGESLEAIGFNNDEVMKDIKSATSLSVLSTANGIYKYNAVFGRLNFNRLDKYLVNITARRDGSSRFGPANQFHNFYAIGAGWVFSKEKFMEKNMPYLSFGKLRTSYGTTGSDDVGDYTFMDLYSVIPNIGVPYQGANGIYPIRIFTPDLGWQGTRKLEAGIELGFFSDRINLTASYFRNRSSNQLVAYSLPAITGFTGVNKNLDALVQNTGLEIELKTQNISTKQFQWSTSMNLTFARNNLISGSPGLSDDLKQRIGHSIATQFVYHFLYVDPLTGLYTFADSKGNPTTQPDPATDATVAIDVSPRYYGGIQNIFKYKGVQLDFLFQFVEQPYTLLYRYNSTPGYVSSSSYGANQPVAVLNHWQQPGDVKPYQRLTHDLRLVNSKLIADRSDLMYGDGSYISLRNASLSWNLLNSWKEKLHLRNAQLYILGQNLITFSKNKDALNREAPGTIELPPLRVLTLGIQITL